MKGINNKRNHELKHQLLLLLLPSVKTYQFLPIQMDINLQNGLLSVRTQDDITFLPFYLKKANQTANQISSISISFIAYTSVFSETTGLIETKLHWSRNVHWVDLYTFCVFGEDRISKMATIVQCYLTAMVNMSSQKIQI